MLSILSPGRMVLIHNSSKLGLASAILLGAAALGSGGPAPKPNILFLLADQWRAQAFGYAGDPNVQTPHLDRLQRESVNCVTAVSGVPVCCPTRASLLT